MPKAFSEFLPEIQYQAPDCPTVVIERALLNASRRFCARSTFWRITHSPISLVAGQKAYALTLPADSEVTMLDRAVYNDQPIEILGDRSLAELYSGGVTGVYVEFNTAHVSAVPDTSEANALTLRLALQPSASATDVSDYIVQHYNDAIIYGALAELLAMRGFNWYDPERGVYYLTMFEQQILDAKNKARGGDAPRVRRVKYGGY